MKRTSPEKWAPSELKSLLQAKQTALGPAESEILRRLCTDVTTRPFWQSLEASGSEHEEDNSTPASLIIFDSILQGLKLPSKPSDLSPRKKEKYLLEVREKAEELRALLIDTRFDQYLDSSLLENSPNINKLSESIFDYPFGVLTLILGEVIEWSKMPDRHDIEGAPSWMLRQPGAPARKYFLLFHLTKAFDAIGQKPPSTSVADVVNVVLELPADEWMTGGAVDSILLRIKERKSKRTRKEARPGNRLLADAVTRIVVPKD